MVLNAVNRILPKETRLLTSRQTPMARWISTSAVERLFTGKTLVGLAAWIDGLLKGQPADTWAQNARLRSCRALRACRYDSWGAIGDHARIFLASLPKRCR